MTIYDAGPLAAGPLCGLLTLVMELTWNSRENLSVMSDLWQTLAKKHQFVFNDL